jgi:hypothetical protein
MRKKVHQIHAFIDSQEKAKFDNKVQCSKLSKSAYVRRACLEDGAITVVDPELLKKIYAEINRLGNNINQIAHLANANKNITDAELRQVISWQRELQITVSQELKGVRKK